MSKLQEAMNLLREYCASRGDADFVDAVESEIAELIAQADILKGNVWNAESQAEAWKTMLNYVCNAESHVDRDSRSMYAMRLLDGEPFEYWYDEIAGRPNGYNAPPKGVLMVLRPYIFGSVMATPNVELTGAARLYRAASSD